MLAAGSRASQIASSSMASAKQGVRREPLRRSSDPRRHFSDPRRRTSAPRKHSGTGAEMPPTAMRSAREAAGPRRAAPRAAAAPAVSPASEVVPPPLAHMRTESAESTGTRRESGIFAAKPKPLRRKPNAPAVVVEDAAAATARSRAGSARGAGRHEERPVRGRGAGRGSATGRAGRGRPVRPAQQPGQEVPCREPSPSPSSSDCDSDASMGEMM